MTAVAVALLGSPLAAPAEGCSELVPHAQSTNSEKRPAISEDLVGLRDIGPVSPGSVSAPIFAISHDADMLAFQIRKADAKTNTVCLGVVVINLASGGVRQLDQGGSPILAGSHVGGFAAFTPSGLLADDVPQFSPDGQDIAYLRRDEEVTRLWWTASDGSQRPSRAETAFDVEAFAWLANGGGIVFSGRPGLIDARRDIAEEGKKGYLFDERWAPVNADAPMVRGAIKSSYYVVNLGDRGIRVATAAERALLSAGPKFPAGAVLGSIARSGALAWTSAADPADVNSSTMLNVQPTDDAKVSTCAELLCSHVTGLWWGGGGHILYFFDREGWANSQLALYRWTPASARPERLFVTDDVFLGCQIMREHLVCGHEGAVTPRRIVSINLETAAMQPLFDPNPEYRAVTSGTVRRLYWTNSYGVRGFGDLVLPLNHRPGQQHPLVIVQYQTRGFLRGGTGDAFPIQVLAAHGFAVLSVEKPTDIGAREGGKTWEDIGRLDRINWADRKSIEASIETGIEKAHTLGVVDIARLGITGLSDGASGTQFALVNSKLFKAAAIETCCEEASVIDFLDGEVNSKRLHEVGYPTLLAADEKFWAGMSFRKNAQTVTTPLLMQISDREYLGALEGFTALKEAGCPVEMYVFPDEYHILWQPAHRLAAYDRVVDWFDFWLRNYVDPAPDKTQQYQRWREMQRQSDRIPGQHP